MTVLLANAPTRIPLPNGREQYFVKAGCRFPFTLDKRREEPCRYLPFPFMLAYTAGLLERERVPVEVCDGIALNIDEPAFLDRCVAYRPSVVVMEAPTPTIDQDLALCRELKARTGAVIALAGTHPTTFADEILRGNDAVDWVFRGEYERNVLAAVLAHRAPEAERSERLARVPGLVRGEGVAGARTVLSGPPGQPDHDLDSLPFPARHLFPTREAPSMWPYWDGFCQRRPAVQMHASRGCPFKCTFCLWISVFYAQGPYRTFSPRRIVDEMEHVVAAHGAREIYFDDDIFSFQEDHVVGLCDEIRARGLRVPWSVMGDAMVITKRSIDAMADAGCIGMKFGIESANTAVLKKLRKPLKPARVREVVAWCAARGIKTHATITFGLEGDTPETMQETLDYCCALPVDSIQFSVTQPFPGTEHFRHARDEGRIVATSWRQFDGASSSVLRFDGMSPEFVASFAKEAQAIWLRARLRDGAWRKRQARALWTVARDQGARGLYRRVARGARFLAGAHW